MKKNYQNLHSHTTYCDGTLTAEDMVLGAIKNGGGSIGFSEHSYVFFEDLRYSMPPEDLPLYIDEVNALKVKYSDKIEIYLGLEQDIFTPMIPAGLDFIIGSVHHIQLCDKYITIDNSFEELIRTRDEHFGGDIYALTDCYWATVAELAEKTDADIIGHFDIIAKQNEGCRLFDENHPRYLKAALDAMDSIMEKCRLFEINTGAMYRRGNPVQYPSELLLRELKKRGGKIIFSSDSHNAESLYYKFDEMFKLAQNCGFTHYKRLTKTGFIDEAL